MNYLLDTHTFLWFINGDNELSQSSKVIIEDPDNVKYISIATFWEIAIKININKLKIEMPFRELEWHVSKNDFQLLPITFLHTNQLINLPLFHRDPFDRIIIAQAICDSLTVLGKDINFKHYELQIIW